MQNIVPKAVNSLSLVLANDNVAKSGAILKDKDGVLLTALALTTAGTATTVVLVGCQHYSGAKARQIEHTLTHLASKISPFLMY